MQALNRVSTSLQGMTAIWGAYPEIHQRGLSFRWCCVPSPGDAFQGHHHLVTSSQAGESHSALKELFWKIPGKFEIYMMISR